jgi:hypothetical protein
VYSPCPPAKTGPREQPRRQRRYINGHGRVCRCRTKPPPPDAVDDDGAAVQGLSRAPLQPDMDRWGVLTIGTGLGNARFSDRRAAEADRTVTR